MKTIKSTNSTKGGIGGRPSVGKTNNEGEQAPFIIKRNGMKPIQEADAIKGGMGGRPTVG